MSSNVTFSSSRGDCGGYLARPEDSGGGAGVIVLQEWWGLVPHIEDVANRLAAEGYVALAPDLYHGKSAVEQEEAQHLMEGLDWGRATDEITGAVAHLKEKEGAAKVGVVGFCMGGALTMIAASRGGVDAYAAYYGFPPAAAADVDAITAPGILLFGAEETFFSVPDARDFAERQRQKGREAEVVVYPRAGHAFFNDSREDSYRADAASDAWKRTLELFAGHLR